MKWVTEIKELFRARASSVAVRVAVRAGARDGWAVGAASGDFPKGQREGHEGETGADDGEYCRGKGVGSSSGGCGGLPDIASN